MDNTKISTMDNTIISTMDNTKKIKYAQPDMG